MKIKAITRFFLIIGLLILLITPFSVWSKENPDLYFFWARGCSYCDQQKVFLEDISEKYPDLKINQYDMAERASAEFLQELMKKHPGSERYFGTVPLTFIGDDFFLGFSREIGNRIEESIKKHYDETEKEKKEPEEKEVFSLPFLGEFDTEEWSLGALAVIIGSIDGLNVCSLGALVIILLLVLALKSRKMTFIFGGLFILVAVLVYGLLIFFWHQLFSILLPYMEWMKILIGLAAFFGGFYFLRQFFKFKKQGPTCNIGDSKIVASATQKLEESFKSKKSFWVLLGAVISFAALVTIIEFPCSAVFPVVFTGILVQANVPLLASLFYIIVYLFFYMLIEVAVFLTAVFTRKIWITSGPFMTWVSLAGALVLFFLAYYYFFVL